MPRNYFDGTGANLLSDFRDSVLPDRREELMGNFPEAVLVGALHKTWHSSATAIYGNWLEYVLIKKAETLSFPTVVQVRKPRPTSSITK
jgi:hypothetical protein